MTPLLLTKDIIFKQTSAEDIYIKFLNLLELPKGNISSPFSEDKKPSFKLYNNGTFKCHSTGKQGDVYQFVADLNQLDCKTQFNEVLNIVAEEMNLITGATLTPNISTKKLKKECKTAEKQFVLSVSNSEMQKYHFDFWNNLGVEKETLELYNAHAVEKYSFFSDQKNKELSFVIKNNILAFSYEVNGNFEVYIPAQPDKKQPKIFCNGLQNGDIFGLKQLGSEKIQNLIICAGKKDTIVAVSRGFKAVTFRSETHNPTEVQINTLQSHCENLYICYDNDNGGKIGRNKIIEKYPQIIPLIIPEVFNDLTDYFQQKTAEDFQNIINDAETITNSDDLLEKNEVWTIFHTAEKYLTENYDIRLNIISNEIEISKKHIEKWDVLNENSIYRELQKKSIKIPKLALISILMSEYVPKYNPFKNYFSNLPEWDQETDYIKQFSDYVSLAPNENKEHFTEQFKKWCVRVVKCAIEANFFNKEAFIITDNGVTQHNGETKQSMGKTSWCRFLCPPKLSKYITQNVSSIEKDALSSLCNNLIINLDELDNMGKFSLNKLKSLFSLDSAKLRLPYDKRDSVFARVASFIGSTNEANFLYDETGSARWICFVVDGINWKYREEFDINNLWSQAVYLLNDKEFIYSISKEELKLNEARNDKFQIVSPERDLINRLFRFPKDLDEAVFLSATDIVEHIHLWSTGIKINPVAVGKALKKAGYNRARVNQQWGYHIVKING